MQVQMVAFSAQKDGNAPGEWEDGVCEGVFGAPPALGLDPPRARFIVLDGATEAYDVRRWVDQLVTSFMSSDGSRGTGPPELNRAAMRTWFARMQEQWVKDSPAPADYIERRKFTQYGSFATMLGCELTGLDGPAPTWRAVALGDTVLFHVRDGDLLATFPPLGPDDFGTTPAVVHTLRSSLDQMSELLRFQNGSLAPGDLLFAATDALAHWIVRSTIHRERDLWPVLTSLCHPAVFNSLIADQRKSGRMNNDDVTLLRARLAAGDPSGVVICI
jgi:hypothetical protein